MKWIGQHIYDLASRFRNDVFLEDISTGTIASGAHLGLDSNNKIVKADDGGGDLTSIVAGTGLSGTSLTGPIPTLNVDATQPNIDSIGTDGDTLSILADQLHMSNATADMPTVKLTNITDDDQAGQLIFEKLRDDDAVAQGQNLGEIWFRGQNNAQQSEDYAYIVGEIDVSTDGEESGILKLGVANHDGGNGSGLILTGGSADNEIDVTVGLGAASNTTVAGLLQVNGEDLNFINANEGKPIVTLATLNTTKGASSELRFLKDADNIVDSEELGQISFYGENDASTAEMIQYGKIVGLTGDVTDGQEAGVIQFQVASYDGVLTNALKLLGDTNADGEVDVAIASGAASVTTVAGTLTMGSTATLTNAGLVVVANQSNITGVGTISSGVWNAGVIPTAKLDANTVSTNNIQTITGKKTFSAPVKHQYSGNIINHGEGVAFHSVAGTYNDATTSASAAASLFASVAMMATTLTAENASVQTENAATLYIERAPAAGTNQTIQDTWAILVDGGRCRFDEDVFVGGDIDLQGDMDVDGTLETDALTIGGATIAAIGTTAITTLGTIGTGVWNGDDIPVANGGTGASNLDAFCLLAGNQTLTGTKTLNSFKGTGGATVTNILDEDAMGSDSATALATQQSIKAYVDAVPVKACFEFKGYGTSDGTNYEMPEIISDNNAPFEHNTSTGSDGLDAQIVNVVMRQGGIVMPYAGVLKKFAGWVTTQGTGTVDVGIFKFTPVDNNSGNVTPGLLVNEQITGAGNTKMRYFSETSSFNAGFAAGDVIYSAVLGGGSDKSWYLNSILEVEWS